MAAGEAEPKTELEQFFARLKLMTHRWLLHLRYRNSPRIAIQRQRRTFRVPGMQTFGSLIHPSKASGVPSVKSRRPICDENVLAVPHTNNRRTKQYKRAQFIWLLQTPAQTEVENIFQRLEQISILKYKLIFSPYWGHTTNSFCSFAYPLTYATSAGAGLPAGFVQVRFSETWHKPTTRDLSGGVRENESTSALPMNGTPTGHRSRVIRVVAAVRYPGWRGSSIKPPR